jgi:hypothetical protein
MFRFYNCGQQLNKFTQGNLFKLYHLNETKLKLAFCGLPATDLNLKAFQRSSLNIQP